MRVLDLFSGIGGFSLGLERAGMTTTAFCEIDPYCRKVLARHWPEVKIHDDITKLDGGQYAGTVDVICGGYPCQGESDAGKRLGADDPRWLGPEMCRVIREVRPRWVICENVRGHIRRGFDTVAALLEDDGFTIWPFIIPACAVGAPHRRYRVWIVAHNDRALPTQQADEICSGRYAIDLGSSSLANAHGHQQHRGSGDVQVGRGWCEGETKDHGDPARDEWSPEPAVGRVAYGIPDRVDSLKSLGNTVVPGIPYRLGRAIIRYEQHSRGNL